MKKGIFLTLQIALICLTVFSCQQKDNTQQSLNESVMQHNDSVFAFLETNWHFQIRQSSNELQNILQEWKIWQEFTQELAIKPVTSIGAYQNKIKVLDNKLTSLTYLKYPEALNTPDIKARITVLSTSIKNLNMFLQLNPIDLDKVELSLNQVNENLDILLSQMQNNLSKPAIHSSSTADFDQLLDTVRRANPTN